ncbi:MAG: phosphotransferase [Rhodobacterales bacterium]|nr:phosphotransferase [Rhodobacterales bacterium]
MKSLNYVPADKRLADATTAYRIDGVAKGDDCIIIISPPDFPDAVAENTSGAAIAQSLLGATLGERIGAPLLADRWQGRSYALFPRFSGFSDNRVVRRAQILWVTPAIMNWLQRGFRQTAIERGTEDIHSMFLVPLAVLTGDDDMPPMIRDAARAAESAVSGGRVKLVTCLAHNDFWLGNIMFKRTAIPGMAPFGGQFKVIDWAGCGAVGYPGFDAIRYLLSAFRRNSRRDQWLNSYCDATDLSQADIAVGCLCALGRIGGSLNQFPKARFVDLAQAFYDFLEWNGSLNKLSLLSSER